MRLVIVTLLLPLTLLQFCRDPQRIGLISLSALSKMDHLTNVFSNVTKSLPKLNSTFNNGSTTFSIANFSAQLYYNDNEQTEQLVDDLSVNVTAGKMHLAFQFNYTVGDKKGVATGRGNFDSFYFVKTLRIYQGILQWNPAQPIPKITISSFLSILNSEPKLEYDAKDEFEDMLNNNDQTHNHSALKDPLVQAINSFYVDDLTYYLNNEQLLNASTLNYTYRNNNITFDNLVTNFTLTKTPTFTGLKYKSQFEIPDFQQKCNVLPQNFSTTFGGVQQYIGMQVWTSTVLYALSKGWLNVDLDRSWQSEMLQFYAGDIANFIDNAKTLKPDTPVKISCKWNNSQYDVVLSKYSDKSLFASVPYSCTVGTDTVKIQSMYFTLNFQVELIVHSTYIQTNVTYVGPVRPEFYREGDFVVTDRELGNRYVATVATTTIGGRTFGTGMPTINRKYPQVYVDREYTVFYDASQK